MDAIVNLKIIFINLQEQLQAKSSNAYSVPPEYIPFLYFTSRYNT